MLGDAEPRRWNTGKRSGGDADGLAARHGRDCQTDPRHTLPAHHVGIREATRKSGAWTKTGVRTKAKAAKEAKAKAEAEAETETEAKAKTKAKTKTDGDGQIDKADEHANKHAMG
jgi:hypothetical protein